MFDLADQIHDNAVIKVIGVGGGGGNAVAHMVANQVEGVEFILANTDAQALAKISEAKVLQLGGELTKGLGAGANPEVGRGAALENKDAIAAMLEGADMVFITAGMGGGTGTGAAPIVAEVAKQMQILTVAVVTRPFSFEGRKRQSLAEAGIAELKDNVDSLIIIPNDKLLPVLGKNISLLNAFATANDVLKGAVQGIADLIIRPGMINVDFADVRTVMAEMGMAMMGSGVARGEGRAREATESAINSPLLEDVDLKGASGVLVNITAGLDLSLGEFSEVGQVVESYASDNSTVVVGTVIDPDMQEEMKVTVVATGLGRATSAMNMAVGSGVRSQTTASPVTTSRKASSRDETKKPTPDFDQLELPAVLRNRHESSRQEKNMPFGHMNLDASEKNQAQPEAKTNKTGTGDFDFLDIPAFLRNQAD